MVWAVHCVCGPVEHHPRARRLGEHQRRLRDQHASPHAAAAASSASSASGIGEVEFLELLADLMGRREGRRGVSRKVGKSVGKSVSK